jgi:hypothetical protein
LRPAHVVTVAVLLALNAAACSKAPERPGPGPATPKAAIAAPAPAEAAGAMRIPASPADGSPAVARKPARIWI